MLMLGLLLAIFTGYFGVDAALAAGNEARCTELGTACIMSEPMNTPTWDVVPGASWAWNPADTTTKEGNVSGAAGGVYENATFDLTVDTAATNPTMFAALPAGHSVTYMPRSAEGAGMGPMGLKFLTGIHPTKRRALRWYHYFDPWFQFTETGVAPLCNSGKMFQGGYNGAYTGGPMMGIPGGWFVYDVTATTQWSGTYDKNGPFYGAVGSLPAMNSMRGKLWRVEVIINDTSTAPGTSSFEWYLKNVTDNTAEITVINNAGDPDMSGIYPLSEVTDFTANGFRSNNGDACPGYMGRTHMLAAAWSTNEGQRIGAATEVEGSGGGGGGGTSSPRFSPNMFRRAGSPLILVNE